MEISHVITLVLVSFLLAIILALIDSILINKHKPVGKPYHIIKFWTLVLAVAVIYFTTSVFYNPLEVFAMMACYWITFDLFLNIFRGLPWDYVPKSSSNPDSWLERMLNIKDGKRYVFVKGLLLFVMLVASHFWSSVIGLEFW